MAELSWALPCKKVLRDESDVMTIIDVLEKVTILVDRERFEQGIARTLSTGKRPLIEHPWTFVSYWIRSDLDAPETQSARLRIVPSDSGPEMVLAFELDMTEATKVRTLYPLPGFPWGGEGQVWLYVERAAPDDTWETLGSVSVELQLQEVPKTPSKGASKRTKKNKKG